MKLLLISIFVTTASYVSAGKTLRMLAALNGGMGLGVNPALMNGGLNPPILTGGGGGFIGQPQFAQLVPGFPAFAVPGPVPNVYSAPAVSGLPYLGAPVMAVMTPLQQPVRGFPGGAVLQQPPAQPDVLRRFRRQIMKQISTSETPVDTQIPLPTDMSTTTNVCSGDHHKDDENVI